MSAVENDHSVRYGRHGRAVADREPERVSVRVGCGRCLTTMVVTGRQLPKHLPTSASGLLRRGPESCQSAIGQPRP
jgi:hypothetical protein